MNKTNIFILILIVILICVFAAVYTSYTSINTTLKINTKIQPLDLCTSNNCNPNLYPNCYDASCSDLLLKSVKGLFTIRDYYILGSYNSCNSGNSLKNNTISLSSLQNVISQGVRLLDFEIYSLENVPIVSTSSSPNNYYIKESNNYIDFADALETIINNAFNISTCPNPTDPIFISLRIKSTNQKMFDNLANIFKSYQTTTPYMLDPEYSFEYQSCNTNSSGCISQNLTTLPIYLFSSKIIIMIDRLNTSILDNQNLMEFVNITTNSINCRLITNYEMKNSPDQQELQNFNKNSCTIVTPDNGTNPSNPSILMANILGIQFTAMNFSNVDSYLTECIDFFNTAGYSFVLKPANLRSIPITIQTVDPNPSDYSFAPRIINSRYIQAQI
jgi:hypothetical protein